MSLAFPLTMPEGGVETQSFQITRADLETREASGRVGGVTAGFPLWRMTVSAPWPDEDETDEWEAFLDALRGSQKTFYARPLYRPYPKAHASGFGGMKKADGVTPFLGLASDWEVNGTRDELTLSGLPSGLTLTRGDFVGFEWETSSQERRAMVRVTLGAVADNAGEVTVSVEMAVPSVVPSDAVATLLPTCLMRRTADGTSMSPRDPLGYGRAELAALQVLLP